MSDNGQTTFSKNDWHVELAHYLPSQRLHDNPGIDDPVNDTGLGPQHGDLQLFSEFAALLSLI